MKTFLTSSITLALGLTAGIWLGHSGDDQASGVVMTAEKEIGRASCRERVYAPV